MGVAFLANGSTHVTGTSLFAEGGASLSLPGLTSYTGFTANTSMLEATGAGSTLTLANLTGLTEDTAFCVRGATSKPWQEVRWSPLALTQIHTGWRGGAEKLRHRERLHRLKRRAVSSTLSDSFGNLLLQVTNGGTFNEAVVTFTNVDLTLDGNGHAGDQSITSFTDATFHHDRRQRWPLANGLTNNGSSILVSGAMLSLPGVTSYAGYLYRLHNDGSRPTGRAAR